MSLIDLARALGFSFTSGVNLYATVAILGLAVRYDWVDLPSQYQVFDNDLVIYGAIAMYLVEFLADKIPWFDSLWDAVHTVIRPLGGALVAVAAVGEASPAVEGLVAVVGASVAATSHFAKAGSRAVVNTSPEPVSNSIASLLEDLLVFALGLLALLFPIVALILVSVLLALILFFSVKLFRAARRRLKGARPASARA
ncbi:MAG TPA: DUF4126 domain-containing protein [Gemmatimonadota bacterium]|nr:DUF4126 domain-containing protein [Gemmatimonadota bacterium]